MVILEVNILTCCVTYFFAVGVGKYCPCEKGILTVSDITVVLFSNRQCYRMENKVIINQASVINPQIIHFPIGTDSETRHKHYFIHFTLYNLLYSQMN